MGLPLHNSFVYEWLIHCINEKLTDGFIRCGAGFGWDFLDCDEFYYFVFFSFYFGVGGLLTVVLRGGGRVMYMRRAGIDQEWGSEG